MMYCFVGDLSGFQNIVRNLPLDQQQMRITQWIELVRSTASRAEIKNVKMISDTIVTAVDETPENLDALITFSKSLLERGLKSKLPLRGAIAQGEVRWTEQVFFGRGVIDAYQLATNQNWLGVAIQSSIVIPRDFFGMEKILTYPTPLKKGRIGLMPVVVWEIPDVDTLMKSTLGDGLTTSDQFLEWDYADKIHNTVIFSLYVQAIKKIENETAEKIDVSRFWGMSPLTVVESVIKNYPIQITKD